MYRSQGSGVIHRIGLRGTFCRLSLCQQLIGFAGIFYLIADFAFAVISNLALYKYPQKQQQQEEKHSLEHMSTTAAKQAQHTDRRWADWAVDLIPLPVMRSVSNRPILAWVLGRIVGCGLNEYTRSVSWQDVTEGD